MRSRIKLIPSAHTPPMTGIPNWPRFGVRLFFGRQLLNCRSSSGSSKQRLILLGLADLAKPVPGGFFQGDSLNTHILTPEEATYIQTEVRVQLNGNLPGTLPQDSECDFRESIRRPDSRYRGIGNRYHRKCPGRLHEDTPWRGKEATQW